MRVRGLENQILMLLLAGSALVAALLVRSVLPEQFLRDDGHLQLAMRGGSLFTDAESFQAVATMYLVTGLDQAPPLAAMLGVGVYTAAMFAALGWSRLPHLSPVTIAMAAATFVPALAYLGQYTKEFATALVALAVTCIPGGRRLGTVLPGDAVVVALCLWYGLTLRPYWLIVAIGYVLLRLVLSRTAHPLALLAVPVLLYAALQPAFQAVLGHGLQGQRDWANAERAGTEVNTLIVSVAPEAGGLMGVGAALVMVALMVVPVPLLLSGSVYHLAAGLAIAGLWLLVLVPVLRGRLREVPRACADEPGRVRAARAAALLLAFLLTQALFEPDYGSALKHLTPLLPLVLLVHLHRRPR